MGDVFPEIKDKKTHIEKVLLSEEKSFNRTLDRGLNHFEKITSAIDDSVINGSDAFKLYDTYGFPLDLTQLMAKEKRLKVDVEGFNKSMSIQKKQAKEAGKFTQISSNILWNKISPGEDSTFVGYDTLDCTSKIHSYATNDDNLLVILDKTPFYAESGGQVGDIGIIKEKNATLKVVDVKKDNESIVHICEGTINNYHENYHCIVDKEHRESVKKNHTATHLMHKALKKVLGSHVNQAGSLVHPDYLRFDLTHFEKLDAEDIYHIESIVNKQILKNIELNVSIKNFDDAKNQGAEALFGEKYGEEVRVLSIGKENGNYFSTELCGGTHVKNTKDIGKFRIIDQSSIAAGVRRVEALRDKQLEDYEKSVKKDKSSKEKNIKNQIDTIKKELSKYKITPDFKDDLNLSENLKSLNRQLDKIRVQSVIKDKSKNIIKDKKIGSFILRQQILTDLPPKELRNAVDKSKKDIIKGIVVGFSIFENKVGVAVGITNELTKKFDAVVLVKIASELLGGKGGGGRKDFAQAGGLYKDKIEESFKAISKKIN